MTQKEINKYLKQAFRADRKNYSRDKKRCKKIYPDWQDDEFNLLDHKFIWGIDLDHPEQPTSFHSWNDAYVYFNRKDKFYYMEVDTTLFIAHYADEDSQAVVRTELDRLLKIDEAFRIFLIENNLRMCAENLPFWSLDLKAETLTELYTRFRILLEGYKWYLNK